MQFILSLDLGTTSCRALLADRQGTLLAVSQKEFTQYYPCPGWVEHDASEIWNNILERIGEVMEKGNITPAQVAAIGITNQRETTVVWDRETGEPICHAIVWQCRRTSSMVEELIAAGHAGTITDKTGLVPDAYFSGTKLRWILENVPDAMEKSRSGRLLFGTIDTWIIWKLTGGAVHATDYTNASRTMLYNIHSLCWDEELLKLLGIPRSMLPEVKPSSGLFGVTNPALFGREISITGVAGDQQAALFGQCCFTPGEMKNTYGTGCFLLMNTGSNAVKSSHGLITTLAASCENQRPHYVLEGSVFIAGAALQWLRDELGVLEHAEDSDGIAASLENSAGGYVVPAFTGLGAPWWMQNARGMIVGLTRGFSRKHLIRATLESLAYQTRSVVWAMKQDAGIAIPSLKVDGGACANNYLMQFQSDLLDCHVIRPSCVETTAMGAAYLAGLGIGYWQNTEDIIRNRSVDRVFTPAMDSRKRDELLRGWQKAVDCALYWAKS